MGTAILFDNIWRNSLIISTILAVAYAAPYSKFGRGCSDIGCLPSEVCVMQHESCTFGQRENKDCGSYPTCKKSGGGGASPGQGTHFDIPNVVTRPTTTTTRRPQTFPQYPSSGGNSNYPGNDYNRGGNTGGYVPPGYDGGNDYYGGGGGGGMTTKKPKSPSIFSNFQDILGDEIGKYLKNQLINQITGNGGGGTGTNSRFGGTSSGGGGSSNPLSSLFGSGGSGGSSNPFSSILGGGGGGGSGSSGFDFGSLLGGGGGGGSQRKGVFGLFNENPSAGKPATP